MTDVYKENEKRSVFVTVGTTCFDALVKAVSSRHVSEILRNRGYTDLLIQMGRGSYIPLKSHGEEDKSLAVDYFTFSPSIADYMRSASLIISHAGSGSIFETLRLNKPLIVVVNEDLMDNHQNELAEELADRKHLFCASPQTLEITDPSTDKSANTSTEKSANTSSDRDAVLSRIETEKRLSLIRAWEESEKIKAENKAAKKMSIIKAWENAKKAAIESDLKRMEEELEKKKAEYGEKMKNKIAMIHKEGEDKRAMVEAKRGEETLKADEMAAKYRAMGSGPKKLFKCF